MQCGHTKLYHFTDTEFVGRIEESIENKGSLSISGGLNSPWKVNLNNFKNLWMQLMILLMMY